MGLVAQNGGRRALGKPVINHRFESVESSEIEEEMFRDTLPEGYSYNIEELSGDEGKFKAHFVADGVTKDNIKQWVAEYEATNGVTVKIKARKKLSNEYGTPPLLPMPPQHASQSQ